jgi:hypothetical protein
LQVYPHRNSFTPAPGAQGKSKGALVIQAYNGGLTPQGARERTGSEYDPQLYCRAVLDIFADRGARGVLSVRGIAVPFGANPGAPEIDEITPIQVNASAGDWNKIIVVPLRHDATFFDWEPVETSSGAMYVWATALPCTMGTEGFEATP